MIELFEQVEERGYARGREQGHLEGILETLTALVDSGMLTAAEAAKFARLTLSKSPLGSSQTPEIPTMESALKKGPAADLPKPGRRPPKFI